jgi:UDP-2,3-diacylglucosamine pyrophosphatase LpxH
MKCPKRNCGNLAVNMEENDFNLIVISDLHLSEGRSAVRKRYSRNEDFFFDESFLRFLKYLDKESLRHQKKWKLIIAGDMIDFLQVTSLPEKGEVDFDISEREKRFGLGTEATKTVWKLKRIMDGHWRFFQGLANFLNRGHHVIIIPGNHDIEFVYELVQNTLKKELPKYLTDTPEVRNLESNLEFIPWFYFQDGLVFIEHGHQYDPLNSFDFFLCPFRTYNGKTTIDLPSGSFFVRYFFNMIEKIDPFADNIKPVTKYICWALKHRLFSSLFRGVLWNYGKFLLEAIKKRKPLSEQEKDQLYQKQNDLIKLESKRFNLPEDKLHSLKKLWVPSSISNDSFSKLLCRFFSYEKGNPYLMNAKKIQEIFEVKFVILGHTHDPDLSGLPNDKERVSEYVNSGTWTKVFSEEERLLREEKEFVYVQILKRYKPKMDLLKWKDELGQGERVNLFEV